MSICLAWDIDGTLLRKAPGAPNLDRLLVEAVVERLAAEPMPVEPTYGKTELQIFTELFGPDLAVEAMTHFEAGWPDHYDPTHYVAFAGVADTLDLVAETTMQQVIVTGNTRRRAVDKVAAVALDHHFEWDLGAYGDESALRSDLVANVRDRVDTTIVVIGDTPRDIEAARTHGAPVIAVATGPFSTDDLAEEGADLVIADFETGRDAFFAFLADF